MNFALRLVGGIDDQRQSARANHPGEQEERSDGGWEGSGNSSGHISSHPRRANAEPSKPELSSVQILESLVGLLRSGGLSPDMKNPTLVKAVAGEINAHLDRWESQRRTLGLRGTKEERRIADHVFADCGWQSVQQSNADDFMDFAARMREPHEVTRRLGGGAEVSLVTVDGWSGRRCNLVKSVISTVLEDFERRHRAGLLNWAKAMPKFAEDDSGDGSRPIWRDEMEPFLAWVRGNRPERECVWTMLAYSGVRADEARTLQIEQIDLRHRQITLTRKTKGHKSRDIPIHKDLLLPVLLKHIGKRKTGPVFKSFPQPPTLTRDMIGAAIDPANIGYHSFRKHFAGWCCLNGVELSMCQKWMGHCNPALTTNIYAIFSKSEQNTAMDRIARLPAPAVVMPGEATIEHAQAAPDDAAWGENGSQQTPEQTAKTTTGFGRGALDHCHDTNPARSSDIRRENRAQRGGRDSNPQPPDRQSARWGQPQGMNPTAALNPVVGGLNLSSNELIAQLLNTVAQLIQAGAQPAAQAVPHPRENAA